MKFSIRDLLFVTVIVALAVGWWLDHQQQVALRLKQARIQGELIRSHHTEALRARASETLSRMPKPSD